MTTQFIRIVPGPTVMAPRGVALGEELVTLVRTALRSVLRALHDSGHRRASRVLREQAERCRSRDPELARFLLEASRFDPRSELTGQSAR